MAEYVLDASALLAAVHDEPGGEPVLNILDRCLMSSVNWSEVVQKAIGRDVDVTDLRREFEGLGLVIVPFSAEQAEMAAMLWLSGRKYGLSLGDRACLALAQDRQLAALTMDQAWQKADLGVAVQVFR
jgi:ribonuclease VapC